MQGAHETGNRLLSVAPRSRWHRISSYLPLVLSIGLVVFGLAHYGWFFDRDYIRAGIVIIPVALWLVWRATSNQQRRMNEMVEPIYVHWSLLFPFFVAAFYIITLLFDPASVHGTFMQIIRWAIAGAWILILMHIGGTGTVSSRDRQGQQLHSLLTVFGLLVSGGSIIQLYGWFPFEGAVMISSDAQLSALGFRLGGWLQYPNTLGMLAGAFAIYHLLSYVECLRGNIEGGECSKAGNDLRAASSLPKMLVTHGVVLLHLSVLGLTESRGAWLATALILVISWISITKEKKLILLKIVTWVTGWALLTVGATASLWIAESNRWASWLPMFCCLLCSTILIMIGAFLQRRGRRLKIAVAIGGGVVLVVVCWFAWLVMPDQATSRLSGHYETASARALFYQDAWRLWQERPWLGSGGDSWRQQFASIQREPYVGKEVHSVLADSMLDIGLIGTLVVGGIVGWAVLGAWRRHRGAGAAVLVIAMHSAIDFDMSYGIVVWVGLAWLVLAWMTPQGGMERRIEPFNEREGIEKFMQRKGIALGNRATALLLSLMLGAALVLSLLQAASTALYSAGTRSNPAYLQVALSIAPTHTSLRRAVAQQLPPAEELALLLEGLSYERRGKALYRALALASERNGLAQDAAAWWKAAIESDRFDKALQTEAVEHLATLSHRAAEQGRPAEARTIASATQELFGRYEAEARRIAALEHPANDKQFAVTPEARKAAASVYYFTLP